MNTQKLQFLLTRYFVAPFILLAGVLMMTAAGCSSSGDGGGAVVPDTLVFTASASVDWVAIQDGDGAWATVEPDTSGGTVYTRTIDDPAGRYGIAAHESFREDGRDVHSIIVLQGTLTELADVQNRPSLTEHSVTITDPNLIARTMFSISRQDAFLSDLVDTAVVQAEEGIRDLVAIENPGFLGVPPTRGMITRGIDVDGPLTLNEEFVNNVNVNGFTEHVFVMNQYGNTHSGNVKFVTANRTRSPAVTRGAIGMPTGYFSLDSGTISSDYYSIELQDEFLNAGVESAIEIKRNSANPDVNFDFQAVEPFSGADADATIVTGLSYTPAAGLPDLIAYSAEYQQDRSAAATADGLVINYILTPGWLSDSTSYTLPDFSGLSGFDADWQLTAGIDTTVGFTAALYNVPVGVPLSINTDWVPDLHMVQPKMRITFTP